MQIRIEALRLAVEASSLDRKVNFDEIADKYYAWLTKPLSKPQKKVAKSS